MTHSTRNCIVLIYSREAGLSSSLNDQLKQILDVVGRGLSRVNTSHHTQQERQSQQAELKQNRSKENTIIREKIEKGLWHDGRIDAICGNGIMSELGMGIERFTEADADTRPPAVLPEDVISEKGEKPSESREDRQAEEAKQKQQRAENLHSVESMPVVIIKGFDSKGGGSRKAELLDVLSQWAASLAEGQVCTFDVLSNHQPCKTIHRSHTSSLLATTAKT